MNDNRPNIYHNPFDHLSDSIAKAHALPHSHTDRASSASSSSPPFDLERAFTHPAGLRVARQLARSLIEKRPIFGSSAEVMNQLRGVMEMSDDYPASATPRQTAGVDATAAQAFFNASTSTYRPGGNVAPQSWGRSDSQTAPSSQPPFFASSSFSNPPILPPIQQIPDQNTFSIQGSNSNLPPRSFLDTSDRRPYNYNPTQAQRTSLLPAPIRLDTTSSSSIRASSHTMQSPQRVNQTSGDNTNAHRFVNNSSVSIPPPPTSMLSRQIPTPTSSELSIIQHYPLAKVQISRQKRQLAIKDTASALVPKKKAKTKAPKPEPAVSRVPHEVWLRMLEFCHPSFLNKARILNRAFSAIVQMYKVSLFINSRTQNGLPPPLPGTSETELNMLLGGFKGCQNPTCGNEKAHRTHWSCMKRLCHDCWLSMILREEKVLKEFVSPLVDRLTLQRLLECIPVALQDSYFKAVDWKEDLASVGGQPRLYKVYYTADIKNIIEKHNALRPAPFKENVEWTQLDRDNHYRDYQSALADAKTKQDEFIETMKERNEKFMAWVKSVESAQKITSKQTRDDHDVNRNARRKLFTRRATEDLPHIPTEFIQQRSDAYKRATRIFRDPGTERGWNTMKPKIEKEWEEYLKKDPEVQTKDATVENEDEALDISEGEDFADDVDTMQHCERDNSHHGLNPFNVGSSNSFRSGSGFAYNTASQSQSLGYQAPLGYASFFDDHTTAARSSPLPTFGQHLYSGTSNMFGQSQVSASNGSSGMHGQSYTSGSNGNSNMYGPPSQASTSSNPTRVSVNSLLQ